MTGTKSIYMQTYYPTKQWAKSLFKAPIVLWRLGLGSICGKLFLLLTVTGRKSGLAHRSMVEYRRINGKKYIVPSFGDKAEWYKT